MDSYTKPLPDADPLTAPYWDSVKAHGMKIQRCKACEKFVFYPRGMCPRCWGKTLEWTPVSGNGTLYAFTVVHVPVHPAFKADVPYVVGLVELAEGPRLMTSIIGVVPDPSQIQIGMEMTLEYRDVTEDVTLPVFRPAA